MWDWRGAFVVSGALGVIGVLLAWTALPRMNTEPPAERPRGVPNFHRVFGNRDVLVLTARLHSDDLGHCRPATMDRGVSYILRGEPGR